MLKAYHIFIIGLGQIGGSLAYALADRDQVAELSGYDIDRSALNHVLQNGIIQRSTETIEDGINRADIIILATPIRATVEILPEIARQRYREKIFVDVCGVKNEIIRTIKKLRMTKNYVSCHPIAGTEKKGINAASKDLFNSKNFIICPLEDTSQSAIDTARAIIQSIGARSIIMNPEDHDYLIAQTSHLPYVSAVVLANMAGSSGNEKDLPNLIGGSFKSATRVACSPLQLTRDMLLSNRENVIEMIDKYINELINIRTMLGNNDDKLLGDLIHKARAFSHRVHYE